MSDSTPTLREKFVKVGTWVFLVFLFTIIVLSFGMPDFIGTSSRMDAYNAARIGGEYLTKAEVADYQKRIEERMAQNLKGLDEKNRKMFEDMAKSRALDEAIDRKLFTQLLSRAGYVPTSSSEGKILANFYKKQFADYIVNGKLDTERLNEFLSQRRLTLDQIGRNMLHDYGPMKAYEMLQASTHASDFMVIDEMRFAATQNSYRIVAVESGARDKLLRGRFNPAEKDIQEKFKTEFLAKDPKSILDAPKRDSIKATLYNEKKAALEKEFAQSLTAAAKSGPDAVAAIAGAKVITITDVGLSTDIDSKKGKDFSAISLSPLSQSDVFVRQRLSAPIGQTVGPVDAGGYTYFFAVTNRKAVELPAGSSYAKIENAQTEAGKVRNLPKDVTFDKTYETQAKNQYAQMMTAAIESYRSSVRIVRYGKGAAGDQPN